MAGAAAKISEAYDRARWGIMPVVRLPVSGAGWQRRFWPADGESLTR